MTERHACRLVKRRKTAMPDRTLPPVAVALVLVLALIGPTRSAGAVESPDCFAEDRIDSSSVETARIKIEKAGFTQVRDLKKGCDNFWHGEAIRNGLKILIVLTPQGKVLVEGD
jgi:hypothetical protein